MQAQTCDLIRRLEEADWFVNVGNQDIGGVVYVSSWKHAIRMSRSRKSENTFLEGQNVLTQQLHDCFPDRYHGKWNEIVGGIKAVIGPLIVRKIKECDQFGEFSPDDMKELTAAARWIILGACMEQEYADCVPPAWETEWAEWYVRGHFPCGWDGDFPENGRLIVF